jgi:hypothetical protein
VAWASFEQAEQCLWNAHNLENTLGVFSREVVRRNVPGLVRRAIPGLTIEVPIGIGAEHGAPAAQLALAHTLGKPAVTSLIAGARGDPAQRG